MSTYNYLIRSLFDNAKSCDKVLYNYHYNNDNIRTDLILLYIKKFEEFNVSFIKMVNYFKIKEVELRYYSKEISACMMNLYAFLNSINTNDIEDELLLNHNSAKHLVVKLSYALGLPVTLESGKYNCVKMVYQLRNIYKL